MTNSNDYELNVDKDLSYQRSNRYNARIFGLLMGLVAVIFLTLWGVVEFLHTGESRTRVLLSVTTSYAMLAVVLATKWSAAPYRVKTVGYTLTTLAWAGLMLAFIATPIK